MTGPRLLWVSLTKRPAPGYIDEPSLPWAGFFQRRCRAVHEPDELGFWGRCELVRGHPWDHALERGMMTPRWSTKWTGTA